MKILHVITSLRTGGAEKLMVDLLPRFRAAGHDVELCIFDGTDTPFKAALLAKGIRIIELGRSANVYHPKYLWRLYRLLKGGKYDVVHTHNTAPQLFAAISSVLCSVVLCTTEHTTSNRRRGWRWYAAVDRWMYSRYRRVICISQKAEENLRGYVGYSKSDILTINNGVDVGRYAAAQASAEPEMLAPGSRKIMMVAGFRWEKDQNTIIRSLTHLPAAFHLFLVGDGVRRPESEALAAELGVAGRVHFLGLRSDVSELLHAADYVVMSSHFEGLSLSSVEGMSVGRPFLSSDVDGLREVVAGAGVLFPHEDDRALAAGIAALEADPERYRAVAEACRRRADNFDIATMAENYLKLYSTILNAG